MSNLTAFLKQNAIAIENEKYVASKRFVDDKKKPIAWEIKSISSAQDEQIRKDCTKKVPVVGKRGQYTQEIDMDAYFARLCVACTVFPDLNNTELQESYGVRGGEALIRVMLNAGEYTDYKAKIAEINGFDVSMDELVEEAKN